MKFCLSIHQSVRWSGRKRARKKLHRTLNFFSPLEEKNPCICNQDYYQSRTEQCTAQKESRRCCRKCLIVANQLRWWKFVHKYCTLYLPLTRPQPRIYDYRWSEKGTLGQLQVWVAKNIYMPGVHTLEWAYLLFAFWCVLFSAANVFSELRVIRKEAVRL